MILDRGDSGDVQLRRKAIQFLVVLRCCCLTSGWVKVEDGGPHKVQIVASGFVLPGRNLDLDQSTPRWTSAVTRSGLALISGGGWEMSGFLTVTGRWIRRNGKLEKMRG
ncbi:hypothetical protein CEXT_771601 [Caerostris extrusa]|uniref:Uncharacterized protein n=1 Tax=Caerostris extrusa TaxID=172846 RepID=A0AAV4VMW3_CAEEX|nr:hypothetical protein CEXT_771601 [Caerostris extrusa]